MVVVLRRRAVVVKVLREEATAAKGREKDLEKIEGVVVRRNNADMCFVWVDVLGTTLRRSQAARDVAMPRCRHLMGRGFEGLMRKPRAGIVNWRRLDTLCYSYGCKDDNIEDT
jgi:hypothetical protein